MAKHSIRQTIRGPVDMAERCSHDNEVVYPNGKNHAQMFFAIPADTLARLRHNIAHRFWFDRMRMRLAQQASHLPN